MKRKKLLFVSLACLLVVVLITTSVAAGPPPHAGTQGPPPHAGEQGPPPHAQIPEHAPPYIPPYLTPIISPEDVVALSFYDVTFGYAINITSATLVPATETLAEHLDVRGSAWPEIEFVVKLPAQWNQRYVQTGSGGLGGSIMEYLMIPWLREGFVGAACNTGHDATREPGGLFGYPSEDNPYWAVKCDDHAYRAVHETAVVAKKIIKAYYGLGPVYSYWHGGSNGGREGLKAAQMYPADFDGVIVGMPVLHITGNTFRDIWVAYWGSYREPGIADNLHILANAVMAKCDGIDGLDDGLINDPRLCTFDPYEDLPPDVFTEDELEAIAKIHGPVMTSEEMELFWGTPLGSEAFWRFWVVGEPNFAVGLGGSFWQYIATDPRFGPGWEWHTHDFDVDPFRLRAELANWDATNPDLTEFKERGGKIIHYHGWADQLVVPLQSVAYYESVLEYMGVEETMEFYKLYMIPGMHHVGSIGFSTVDWMTAIIDWVENGIEPERLIGSREAQPGLEGGTRPHCPYPQVAQYKGEGDIWDADSFVCVWPADWEQ